ncbi:MAG: LysR family transcriptional regulator [Hyphomicrobiales bacterium]|nr:LysR family transcriptional regulator [Hyphomicrobiales bacterium]
MTRDLRSLTLEQLRVFAAVAESGSFTQAARILTRTQSALTLQIKRLEDLVGLQLFLRSRGHVSGLTEAGQRFLPYAHNILKAADDAWQSLNQSITTGNVRVGIMDDFEIGGLIELVRRFKSQHPNSEVGAISDFSFRLENRIERGEIDIAIVKRLAADQGQEDERMLRRERLRWIAAPGFRWSPATALPLVVFHEGCVYRRHILEQLKTIGVSARIAYDGYSYANVRKAVAAGMGISAFSEGQLNGCDMTFIDALGGVALPDLGMVEIVLKRSRENDSSAVEAMAQEMSQYVGINIPLSHDRDARCSLLGVTK